MRELDIFESGDETYSVQFDDVSIGEIYSEILNSESNVLDSKSKIDFSEEMGAIANQLKNIPEKVTIAIISVIKNPDFQSGFLFTLTFVIVTKSALVNATENKNSESKRKSRTWNEFLNDCRNFSVAATVKKFWRNPKELLTYKNVKRVGYITAGALTGATVYYTTKRAFDYFNGEEFATLIKRYQLIYQIAQLELDYQEMSEILAQHEVARRVLKSLVDREISEN